MNNERRPVIGDTRLLSKWYYLTLSPGSESNRLCLVVTSTRCLTLLHLLGLLFFFFCFVYCSHMSMLAATMSHVLVSSASPLLHLQACNAKRQAGCAKRPTEPKPFSSFLTCFAAMYPDSFHRKLRLEERRCSGEFGLCLAIGTSVCYVRFSARLTRSGYFSWLWKFAHNSRVCVLCASTCVCSLRCHALMINGGCRGRKMRFSLF